MVLLENLMQQNQNKPLQQTIVIYIIISREQIYFFSASY